MKRSKPKIGIIGLGRIGQWGEAGKTGDLPAIIRDSDILVLSIWFEGIGEFLKEHAGELYGKIIIDPSNPVTVDETGAFRKLIAENESSGELHKTFMPEGAKMAKVFCSLGSASLSADAFKTPERAALLYANDDRGIDHIIEELILDSGFAPVRLGGIDQSIRMEIFGDLNGTAFSESIPTVAELKSRI